MLREGSRHRVESAKREGRTLQTTRRRLHRALEASCALLFLVKVYLDLLLSSDLSLRGLLTRSRTPLSLSYTLQPRLNSYQRTPPPTYRWPHHSRSISPPCSPKQRRLHRTTLSRPNKCAPCSLIAVSNGATTNGERVVAQRSRMAGVNCWYV